MDREEQIAHLRLIRTPNIGPMTFSLLLQRYGSARAALARLSPATEKEIEASRTRILAALGAKVTDIDEIIRWCDEPVSTVLVAILELELAGRISRHHSNRICRIADAGTSD